MKQVACKCLLGAGVCCIIISIIIDPAITIELFGTLSSTAKKIVK